MTTLFSIFALRGRDNPSLSGRSNENYEQRMELIVGGRCVFDPFSGSGTTANACKELGVDFIGCELSAKQ